jgi:hypothetical protein
MYSETVINASMRRIHDKMQQSDPDFRWYDFPEDYWQATVSTLTSLVEEDGTMSRILTPDERKFVRNERLRSRIDFKYWVERYGIIYLDDLKAKKGRFKLWKTQLKALEKMAKAEEEMWDEIRQGAKRVDGLCFFATKSRQVGYTMLFQGIGCHRSNFYSNIRGVTASVNDQKTQLIYVDRYQVLRNGMPWWMITPAEYDTITGGIKLTNGSRMHLEDATQRSGLGQGNQWDFAHLTECASWPDPVEQFENHLYPSLPRSLWTAAFLESTAQGVSKGGPIWWKKNSEAARKGKLGRWRYVFIPWYLADEKNVALPPIDWSPSAESLAHAKMVEETSPDLVGYKVVLTAAQLYWYEQERSAAQSAGTLNIFFQTHPATPTEMFQYGGISAFPTIVLESVRHAIRRPVPYQLLTPGGPSPIKSDGSPSVEQAATPDGPSPYRVGTHVLAPVADPHHPEDPRGQVLMWEPPQKNEKYVIGADTAGGIPGWNRLLIGTENDNEERDNGVLSVWRIGRGSQPEVQVAEFAAPIGEHELALYAYLLGLIYEGSSDMNQALIHAEVDPKGAAFHQELVGRYNYLNLMPRYRIQDGVMMRDPQLFGWQSNMHSMRLLWSHSKRHVASEHTRVRSEWLADELTTLQADPVLKRAAAEDGYHDDRCIAAFLAWWAANNWAYYDPYKADQLVETKATPAEPIDWQSSDMDYEEMLNSWDNTIGHLLSD